MCNMVWSFYLYSRNTLLKFKIYSHKLAFGIQERDVVYVFPNQKNCSVYLFTVYGIGLLRFSCAESLCTR